MSTDTSTSPLPFTFGGFTVPPDCRRIFVTAELESSSGDPRIQPTGFPDIGPVLYPDPNPDKSLNRGLIGIIESEPSMGNWLEVVCLSDKYEGTLKDAFEGLPYLRVEEEKKKLRTFGAIGTT